MKLIICTNTETLQPIWQDIYDGAGLVGDDNLHGPIANAWVGELIKGLPAHIDYDLESAYDYSHGGSGSGPWMLVDDRQRPVTSGQDYDLCSRAAAAADREARDSAMADITD